MDTLNDSECLTRFLTAIRGLNDMPSHVDDTLIDRLTEFTNFDNAAIDAVLKALSENCNDISAFGRTVHLRFVKKILDANIEIWEEGTLKRFLGECMQNVSLSSCPSLLNSLLEVLCALEERNLPFPHREEAKSLATSLLSEECVSLFVKKEASKLLSLTFEKEDCSSTIALLADVLVRENDLMIDCISELLNDNFESISDVHCARIIDAAPLKSALSLSYCRLVAKLIIRSKENIKLDSKNWKNDKVKLNVTRFLIAQGCKELIPAFLEDPDLKLGYISVCIPFLSQQERMELVRKWIPVLGDARRCPAYDVLDFLSYSKGMSDVEYDAIYESLSNRFWQSPDLLSSLLEKKQDWAVSKCSSIIESADSDLSSSEWELRDSAVEFLRIVSTIKPLTDEERFKRIASIAANDDSHFVRANALRFVGQHRPELIYDVAANAAIKDADSEPRIAAIRILRENFENTQQLCAHILPSALYDCNADVRMEAVAIASNFIAANDENATQIKKLLEDCRMGESECLEEINRVLGYNNSVGNKETNGSGKLLRETIAAISLSSDDDGNNVKDCY